MPRWTPESRRKQAELMRQWQPWKTVVPKTLKGKAASRRNALRHGNFSEEVKMLRRILSECRKQLKLLGEIKK